MANGQTYFMLGFKDQVQGVHPENYPGTFRNLRRLKNEGAQMYPNMRWVSVEKIRRLMVAPFPFESQAADWHCGHFIFSWSVIQISSLRSQPVESL
jgi:hypothetical protein